MLVELGKQAIQNSTSRNVGSWGMSAEGKPLGYHGLNWEFIMMLVRGIYFYIAMFISSILPIAAFSQEIIDYTRASKANPSGCAVLIQGQIEEGLSKRIQDLQLERLANGVDAPVVCLNSEGGSLREAVELLDYFIENQILTYVNAGDACLSACAVAFLGGSAFYGNGEGTLVLSRSIHPEAVLESDSKLT